MKLNYVAINGGRVRGVTRDQIKDESSRMRLKLRYAREALADSLDKTSPLWSVVSTMREVEDRLWEWSVSSFPEDEGVTDFFDETPMKKG